MKKKNDNPRVISKYEEIVGILYYVARCLSVFLLIGLCIISTLYAVGNLVTIQAENFACPQYTEEQVRRTNFERRDKDGKMNSCLYIDRQILNFDAIYSLDISIYTASFAQDIDVFDVTLFVFYSFIALISATLTIYHGYYLLYDSCYVVIGCTKCAQSKTTSIATADNINGKNTLNIPHKTNPRFKKIVENCSKSYHRAKTKHKQQRNAKKQKPKRKTQVKSESRLEKCLHGFSNGINYCRRFMSDNFYFDSKYWLFGIVVREFFEIIIQFYALLLYGGMDLFDSNENVLSQEGYIVEGVKLDTLDLRTRHNLKIGGVCTLFSAVCLAFGVVTFYGLVLVAFFFERHSFCNYRWL